jgi:hypothetical protein
MHAKCLNCDGSRIVSDVRVVDRGHSDFRRDLKLEVYGEPDAIFFKEPHDATLRADVCEDCGHVMFFVARSKAVELSEYNDR